MMEKKIEKRENGSRSTRVPYLDKKGLRSTTETRVGSPVARAAEFAEASRSRSTRARMMVKKNRKTKTSRVLPAFDTW